MLIDVSFLPRDVESRQLSGWLVVAIDVLRATTTAVTALHNGARAIRPVLEPPEAWRERACLPPGSCLLGGERQGIAIPGFDLGNSPAEYDAGTVRGKTVVLTTSNGTRLLIASRDADEVVMGSIVNAASVSRFVRECGRPVLLACAGRFGRFSLEDTLCAGQIIAHLTGRNLPGSGEKARLSGTAAAALGLYHEARRHLYQTVRQGTHGRYLTAIGLGEDIAYCCREDLLDEVPRRSADNLKEWMV